MLDVFIAVIALFIYFKLADIVVARYKAKFTGEAGMVILYSLLSGLGLGVICSADFVTRLAVGLVTAL